MSQTFAQLEERFEAREFLRRHGREVDRVADDAVAQEVAQRRHRFHANELLSLTRGGGDVRRRDHLRQLLQPVIDGRLFLKHVEGRAADLSGLDGICERRLVYQIAACRVDDPDAFLRLRQPLGIDDVLRRRRRGHMERQVIRPGEEIVERHQLDAEITGNVLGNKRIVRDDAHVERGRAPRHFLADASEPRQPERLLAHFLAEEFLFLPFALLHRGVRRGDVARERQHETDGQLRDADAVGARRVHHDDAARAGGGNIDVVHAGARAGDGAQLRRSVDQRSGDFRGAAHDDGIGVGEIGDELFGRPACTGVDGPAFRAQHIQRGWRKVVGDYDFQCWSLWYDAFTRREILPSIICGWL